MAGNFGAAASGYREAIKLRPNEGMAHYNLGIVLRSSGDPVGACFSMMQAVKLQTEGTYRWAEALTQSFGLLLSPECADVPRPEWWCDKELLVLSRIALMVIRSNSNPWEEISAHHTALLMRSEVLDNLVPQSAPWANWGVMRERTVPDMLEAIRVMNETIELGSLSLGPDNAPIEGNPMSQALRMRIWRLQQQVLANGGSLYAEPSSMSIIGDPVIINGLKSQPALNGTMAKVLSYDGRRGRYCVELDLPRGKVVAMKPSNISGGGQTAMKLSMAAEAAAGTSGGVVGL